MQRLALQRGLADSILLLALVAGVRLPVALAQGPIQEATAFEVASIRPAAIQHQGGEGSARSQIEYAADSLTMQNINLSEMLQWAYGLDDYQVQASGPVADQRFDIRARAGEPAPVSTLRRMLQDLLATRFKVRIHREQQRKPVYELVVAKDGPRLGENKADSLPASYPRESLPRVSNGDFVFANVTMEEFAQKLALLRGIGLPVIDRTGIGGVYDITLKAAATVILETDGSSLPALIHEQLGLRLVSAKEPIDVLILDHAEEPSAN